MVGERSAVRKLVEIANAFDAVQDGRIFVELVNRPSLTRAARRSMPRRIGARLR
jgi:hypothetical protein